MQSRLCPSLCALDDKAIAGLLWICCCGEGPESFQRSGWELVLADDGGEPTETCCRFGRVEYKLLPASGWQIVRGTPAERGTATSWRSCVDLQGPGSAMFY